MVNGDYGLRKDVDNLHNTVSNLTKASFDTSKTYSIKCNVEAVTYSNSKFIPSSLRFTSYVHRNGKVDLFTGGYFVLYASTDGETYTEITGIIGSGGHLNYDLTDPSYNFYRARLFSDESKTIEYDYQTIPVLKDDGSAESGLVVMLGNEASLVPTDYYGVVEADFIVNIPFYGFYGLDRVPITCSSSDISIPAQVVDYVSIGTITPSEDENDGNIPLTFLGNCDWGNLDSGDISIDLHYHDITVTRKFNFAKSKKGTKGDKGEKGDKGDTGKGIVNIVEEYALNNSPTSAPTTGWSTTPSTPTSTQQYLWNHEKINYTDGTSLTTTDHVCLKYTKDGKGITSITNYYATSTTYTTPTTGWNTTVPTLSSTNKYLWNYEHIIYTDSTTFDSDKRVIGVYGDKGEQGETGVDGAGREYVYKRTTDNTQPSTPTQPAESIYNQDDYVPDGWTDDAQGVTIDYPYEWVLERMKYLPTSTSTTAIWESYTYIKRDTSKPKTASLWAKYGKDGESINSIKNYYKADSRSTGVAKSEITSETIPTLTSTNKYLWNYEKTFDTSGTLINETDPHIVAMYSSDGRTIISITERFAAYTDGQNPPASSSTLWKDNISEAVLDATNKYLWCEETINYNTGSPTILYHLIAVYGEDGKGKEFIFARTEHKTAPTVTDDDYGGKHWYDDDFVPEGWNDDALDTTKSYPYQWVLTRNKIDGVWEKYTTKGTPRIWSIWDGLQFETVTVDMLETVIKELQDNSCIEEKITLKGTDTLLLRKDKYSSIITGYLDIADPSQYQSTSTTTTWVPCGLITNSLFIPGSSIKFPIYDNSANKIAVISLDNTLTSGYNIRIGGNPSYTSAVSTFITYFQMKSASDTKPLFLYIMNDGTKYECQNVMMGVNQGGSFICYLYDKTRTNPISGATVQLIINGVTYTHTTDSNGKVSRTINLNPGIYTFTLKYTGNLSSYAATTVTTKCNVIQL